MQTSAPPSAPPESQKNAGHPPDRYRTVLLAALVASLTLLAASLIFRFFFMDPLLPQRVAAYLLGKEPHFVRDPVIGWVPTPNLDQRGKDPDGTAEHLFKTETHGFRNPPLVKDFAGRRLVLLGDSMVWGVGVDQDKIAGSIVRDLLGDGYEVIVAGTPGWSTDQEYLFFQSRILPLEPVTVFWFVTAVNDIVCNMFGQATSGVPYRKPRFVFDPGGTLTLLPIDPDAPSLELGETVEKNSSMLNLFHKHPDAQFKEGLRLTAAILEKGRREWTQKGIDVYFVVFRPNLVTYVSTSMQEFAAHFGYNPDDFSEEMAMENIRSVAEQAGIDLYFFDTRREMMFRTDGHLNVDGSAALARFVVDILDGRTEPLWRYASRSPSGPGSATEPPL